MASLRLPCGCARSAARSRPSAAGASPRAISSFARARAASSARALRARLPEERAAREGEEHRQDEGGGEPVIGLAAQERIPYSKSSRSFSRKPFVTGETSVPPSPRHPPRGARGGGGGRGGAPPEKAP